MLAIGVDIGGTKIAAGVVDERGEIIDSAQRPTPAREPEALESAVADAVRELRRSHDVRAVGIGAAGFVAADRRTVVFAANLAWRDRPLAAHVEELVDLPVVVENDANAAGWAEFLFGVAADVATMLMMSVGSGLGGAIVVDGNLVRGAGGFAGEIAHMSAVPNGQWCGCGNRGCLEQYTAGRALVRSARSAASTGDPSAARLLRETDGDAEGIDGPLITRLALEGDEGARKHLEEIGHWLGRGAASIAAILDPGMIVIGGGVSEAGDLLLEPARRTYAEHLTARAYRSLAPFAVASTGNRAGMIGAADLARQFPAAVNDR
ncbi:MAG: ROK family protein [Brachybacterium sp.]|nr:ROK family protein [Brachybacterium sp.]